MPGLPLSTLMLATLVVPPAYSTQASSAYLSTRLDATVTQYSLAAPSLVHALHRLATDFKLPMGVEWVRDTDSLRPVRLSWDGVKVSQILAAVVAEYPPYRLSTEGAIIHVFHEDVRVSPSDPLALHLGPIDIRDEQLGVASAQRLRSTVSRARQPRLPAGEAGSAATGFGGDKRVSVKASNPTLREALDALALSAAEVIWIVTYPPRNRSDVRSMTTVSLGGHAVQPQHQPHWVFLPWGPSSLVKVSGREPGRGAR